MLDCGPGSFFLTPSQLSSSSVHALPLASQLALRFYSCEIIQEAGILLRLPQVAMASAQVLLHRFFCKRSFQDFDCRSVAASCLWLAMKLEESGTSNRGEKPSRLPGVVTVFDRIRCRREGDPPLAPGSDAFRQRKEELLRLESQILVELGFVCHVEHPHKFLVSYLNKLDASPELVQESWNLVNDSLRTTLCVTFPSNVIACGVIYAAARRLCVPLPENPAWWLLFDVTLEQILEVCKTLAHLYRQPKAQYMKVRECAPAQSSQVPKTSEAVPAEAAVRAKPVLDDNKIAEPISQEMRPSCDGIECIKNVSLISPGSASKLINSCLLNASGSRGVVLGGIVIAHKKFQSEATKKDLHPDQGAQDKRDSKSLDDRAERRRSSHDSTHRRAHVSRKRDRETRDDVHRESRWGPEHKQRRRECDSSVHYRREDRCLSRNFLNMSHLLTSALDALRGHSSSLRGVLCSFLLYIFLCSEFLNFSLMDQ